MPLTLGSVSVADNGTVTKSGEVGTLYDLLEQDALTAMTAFPGAAFPTGPAAVPRLRAQARLATTIASWVVVMLTTRASAKIAANETADGLQRTPDPNTASMATKYPTVDKFLPIV